MSYRTCPDWPTLMEVAPDLQFKHYTIGEVELPGEALVSLDPASHGDAEICCDVDHHVYYAGHTHPEVAAALRESHWFELTEWTTAGPGTATAL